MVANLLVNKSILGGVTKLIILVILVRSRIAKTAFLQGFIEPLTQTEVVALGAVQELSHLELARTLLLVLLVWLLLILLGLLLLLGGGLRAVSTRKGTSHGMTDGVAHR